MKRRSFIQSAVAGSLTLTPLARALGQKSALAKTPADYEGPYYPEGPRNKTSDLVKGVPRSRILHIRGRIRNVEGEAISGAMVDIWHTDPLGRYKHSDDRTPGFRWDDFLYWGESIADEEGRFEFRTYVPGAYSPRPAHVHYKVWLNKQNVLTSQLYFQELGGTRGQSRFPRYSDRQTVSLAEIDDETLESILQIVI